jgi:hypothetical protein
MKTAVLVTQGIALVMAASAAAARARHATKEEGFHGEPPAATQKTIARTVNSLKTETRKARDDV